MMPQQTSTGHIAGDGGHGQYHAESWPCQQRTAASGSRPYALPSMRKRTAALLVVPAQPVAEQNSSVANAGALVLVDANRQSMRTGPGAVMD